MHKTSNILIQEEHLRQLQGILRRHFPGCEVWAYGSRVNGDAHEGSDLDLVVHGAVAPAAYDEGIEALRNSTLPMLVDLHFWDGLPEDFRDNIARRHVVIQEG